MKYQILILSFAVSVLSFDANAQVGGNCGPKDSEGNYTESCLWSYDETSHKLILTGDGKMHDFWASQASNGIWYTNAPWRNLSGEIYDLEIGGNLTNIGACAIYNLYNLQNYSITAPIEELEGQSVTSLYSKEGFEIPATVKKIGREGLGYLSRNIVLGSNIESIGIDAFTQSRANVVIYCEDTTAGRCADLINAKNSSDIDKLVHFTTGEDGVYYTEDGKYFASTLLMQQGKECDSQQICQEIVAADKNGETFLMDGKFYASLDDWAKNKSIKKRIYTVDEANKVTGARNRVTIRYR